MLKLLKLRGPYAHTLFARCENEYFFFTLGERDNDFKRSLFQYLIPHGAGDLREDADDRRCREQHIVRQHQLEVAQPFQRRVGTQQIERRDSWNSLNIWEDRNKKSVISS